MFLQMDISFIFVAKIPLYVYTTFFLSIHLLAGI